MSLFLMICHDHDIDRRIIQEAITLKQQGWNGTIIALSRENEDTMDEFEGIRIHRIGKVHIAPDCPTFRRYERRKQWIVRWSRGCTPLDRINWFLYGIDRIIAYRNYPTFAPLPFDSAFFEAGLLYPSDLVIAHDLPALKAAYRLAQQWNVSLIYDAHELFYEQVIFSKIQKKIMYEREKDLIVKCDAILTVNQSIADELTKRYFCGKPHVLMNGIDPPPGYNPEIKNHKFHDFFHIEKTKKIILYQGGLNYSRNLEKIIISMKYVKNPNVVLIFMGDGPLKKKLNELIVRYNLTKKILLKESVPQEELLYWTASADIGIIPYTAVDLNTEYCTPNKLFEYIQAGLPILSSNLPELNKIVRQNHLGWTTDLDNPYTIAHTIDTIFADDDEILNIRLIVLKERYRFSWNAIKDEFLEVIRNIFTKKNCRGI